MTGIRELEAMGGDVRAQGEILDESTGAPMVRAGEIRRRTELAEWLRGGTR